MKEIPEDLEKKSEEWEGGSIKNDIKGIFQLGRSIYHENRVYYNKEAAEYSQKVKEYSHYEIGRKISKNIKPFLE